MKSYGRGPKFTGRIQRLPGRKITVDTQQAATLTEIWGGDFDQLTHQTPGKNHQHPVYWGLYLTTKEIVEEKLGTGKATLTYKGIDPSFWNGGNGEETEDGGNEEFPEIDLEEDTDVEEIPIQAHPDFLSVLVPAAGSGEGQAAFDETTKLFLGFGPQSGGNLAGVESYQVARKVTTRYWYSTARATLPVGVRVPGGLRTSLKSSRQGAVWKNSEVIRASDPNPLIYP
jgi:hypothetical protein